MKNISSVETLSPGDYVKEELRKRGWTQADLARIIDRPLAALNEAIQGKRSLSPEMAVAFGIAFGNDPHTWLEREAIYRISQLSLNDSDDTRRRTRLFQFAPVEQMQKRGWISTSTSLDYIEAELLQFFGVPSLDDEPQISAVARQRFASFELTAAQRAWVFRASQLASVLNVRRFDPRDFASSLSSLHALASSPEKVSQIPPVLAELGVRFVIVESLPRTAIDGAMFWLTDTEPVIAMSMRFERIDYFWHTLAHEISHVKHGDAHSVDLDMASETSSNLTPNEVEGRADREAAEFLIPRDKLHSFVLRTRPYYSKERISQFALRMGVHPGIVVGQLQHRKHIPYSAQRETLAKVRDILINVALTDGFGKPSIQLNH
jgi:HTH-type transcriptional regulator/antitoxin HigA